jgi:hypothetical protein
MLIISIAEDLNLSSTCEKRNRQYPRALLNGQDAIDIYRHRRANLSTSAANSHGPCKHTSALAFKYNVSPKTIRDIWNRRTWTKETKHLWTEDEMPMVRIKTIRKTQIRKKHKRSIAGCALVPVAAARLQMEEQQCKARPLLARIAQQSVITKPPRIMESLATSAHYSTTHAQLPPAFTQLPSFCSNRNERSNFSFAPQEHTHTPEGAQQAQQQQLPQPLMANQLSPAAFAALSYLLYSAPWPTCVPAGGPAAGCGPAAFAPAGTAAQPAVAVRDSSGTAAFSSANADAAAAAAALAATGAAVADPEWATASESSLGSRDNSDEWGFLCDAAAAATSAAATTAAAAAAAAAAGNAGTDEEDLSLVLASGADDSDPFHADWLLW